MLFEQCMLSGANFTAYPVTTLNQPCLIKCCWPAGHMMSSHSITLICYLSQNINLQGQNNYDNDNDNNDDKYKLRHQKNAFGHMHSKKT